MSTEDTQELPVGTELAHYRIQSVIGAGAMGTVYRATDTGLDRDVAVKVLRSDVADDAVHAARFVREARAAARIRHTNLAHVYFVGQDEDVSFFAMELIPGQALDERVAQEGALALNEAIDVLIQTARGLDVAHRADIVHRDIKPSNLIRDEFGTIKITDFGLAKSLTGDIHATGDGMAVGSPAFMAPEQCRGRDVDGRADIYSLALTGWTLLTGKSPMDGLTLGEVIDHQLNQPLPSVRSVRPELPIAIDHVLKKMAAKDPAARPQTMSEVIELLESARPRTIHPASIAARAIAFSIDLLLAMLLTLGVAFAYAAVSTGFSTSLSAQVNPTSLMMGWIWLLTQALPEIAWGQSIGKSMLHMKVVSAHGTRPPMWAAWARAAIRIPYFAVWATGIPYLAGGDEGWMEDSLAILTLVVIAVGAVMWLIYRKRTLSDWLTRTRVVAVVPPAERIRAAAAKSANEGGASASDP